MRIKVRIKNESLICFLFFLPQINYYISAVLSSYNFQTVTPPIYAVLIVVGMCSVLYNLHNRQCFIWSFGIIVVLLMSLIVNWNVSQYMVTDSFFQSPIVMLCSIYFPIFLFFLTEVDIGELLRTAVKYSTVTIALSAIAFINYIFIQRTSMPDYMTFAYMIVSPIMFCTISAIQGKKTKTFWAALGYLIILVGGCRGALLTVSIFLLICFIRLFATAGKKSTLLVKCIVVIFAFAVALNIENVLNAISLLLEGFGYESRVFAILTGESYGGEMNTFFSGVGRNDIWKMAWDHIRIIGYGLFGDRTVVVNEYNNASYAHNWILEMLVSFGWILGTVAVLYVLWCVIKSIIVANQRHDRINVLLSYAIFCIIMVKHSISASFANSIDFWFYLGLGYCIIKTSKEQELTEVFEFDEHNKIKGLN